jgi:ketosteroid isomerase-like protein
VGDDVAFGHSFNRLSGTSENGTGIGPWVRYMAGCWKIGGNWFIAHDQVSVPVDPGSGTALLNLEP